MGVYFGVQQWWKQLQPPELVTNGLVLNLDAGNLASYNPNAGGNTYLLLHADGANNSTNFVDSGSFGHTITRGGTAKISTVESKFGGSSIRLDTGSSLGFPRVTLDGDFTLALWVNFDDISADQALLGCVNCQNSQLFRFNADGVSRGLMSYSNGGHIFFPTLNEVSFMQSDQWYYLTMTRSGNVVRTFIDGQLLQTNNNYSYMIDLDTIGAGYLGNSNWFTGYIDDVVILDGTCLYTESFTAPVAPYPNPGISTTWYDLSGNGNNGTLVNGVSYDSANQGSLVFDGIDDYGTVPYNSFFDLSGDYALEGWFKSNSFSSTFALISKDTYGQSYDWGIWIANDTTISIYSAATTTNVTATVSQLQPDTWYNIIITGIGGVTKIYLNSVEVGSGNLSITNQSQSFITLGCIGWNYQANFTNGNISVLRVYQNKGLTQQEVTQNYNALKGRFGL